MAQYTGTGYEYAPNDPRNPNSWAARSGFADRMRQRGAMPAEGVPLSSPWVWAPGQSPEDYTRDKNVSLRSIRGPAAQREIPWWEAAGNQQREQAAQRLRTLSQEIGSQGRSGASMIRREMARSGMGGEASEGAAMAALMGDTSRNILGAHQDALLSDSADANRLNKEVRGRDLQEWMRKRGYQNQEAIMRLIESMRGANEDKSWMGELGSSVGGFLGGRL